MLFRMKTRVSLSYFVTYFRFKGSLITNFPSIKELLKNLWQINVLFLNAISYLQFNVTHLIYVVKCFLWMFSYLLQLKIIWISFSIPFFSEFLQIFISEVYTTQWCLLRSYENINLFWLGRFCSWSYLYLYIFPF